MSALSDVRAGIAQTLRDAGLTAYDHNPELYDLPAVFVGPGDPYIDGDGAAFGAWLVNTVLVLVVPAGDNDRMATALDDYLATVLPVLDAANLTALAVESPGAIALPTGQHLGVVVRLAPDEITL